MNSVSYRVFLLLFISVQNIQYLKYLIYKMIQNYCKKSARKSFEENKINQ